MVSCRSKDGKDNIITLGWVGTINTQPPMLSISVRKERYSYEIIKERGEFVVNLPTQSLTFATDYCGVKSGEKVDKFAELKLSKETATNVDVAMIKECPVNIECVVDSVIELGSHDLFLAKIVAVNVDEKLINEDGKLCLDKAKLICYSHGEYWSLNKVLGFFGFSIQKKKKRKLRKR